MKVLRKSNRGESDYEKNKKAGATRQKIAQWGSKFNWLVADKPVVSAFPGFLQDFANPVFVFFQAANDGQIVIGGKAYGYLAWKSRELLFNASGEFII